MPEAVVKSHSPSSPALCCIDELKRGSEPAMRAPPPGYHSIPAGWTADEILAAHRLMRGTFPLEARDRETSAGVWLPPYLEYMRYQAMLTHIPDGARAGDDGCIELCVRYIELDHFGSMSGYRRKRFLRVLCAVPLQDSQINRLNRHFLKATEQPRERRRFEGEAKFWARLLNDEGVGQLRSRYTRSGAPQWFTDLLERRERGTFSLTKR